MAGGPGSGCVSEASRRIVPPIPGCKPLLEAGILAFHTEPGLGADCPGDKVSLAGNPGGKSSEDRETPTCSKEGWIIETILNAEADGT